MTTAFIGVKLLCAFWISLPSTKEILFLRISLLRAVARVLRYELE